MAVCFNLATLAPLARFSAVAPDGAAVGIIGEEGAGKGRLLRLAAGRDKPVEGNVAADEPRFFIGPEGPLAFPRVRTLLLDHALASSDAFARAKARAAIERLRREGATILLASHDELLLLEVCDEVWWLHQGALAARDDPAEVLERYHSYVAERLRQWGQTGTTPLPPSLRRGDGRARLVDLQTLGKDGAPTTVWVSGEPAGVQVTVRFEQPVDEPVVGIMIRNRIGMEVYGTNTLLERLPLGPCQAGDTLRVTFAFNCGLCPNEYTLTAASHDPNGLWHDWLEDAVLLLVAGTRYTAGVADLRARATFERI